MSATLTERLSTADAAQAVVDSAINECGTFVEVYKLQDLENSIADQRAIEAATVALLTASCELLAHFRASRYPPGAVVALESAADALASLIGGEA